MPRLRHLSPLLIAFAAARAGMVTLIQVASLPLEP